MNNKRKELRTPPRMLVIATTIGMMLGVMLSKNTARQIDTDTPVEPDAEPETIFSDDAQNVSYDTSDHADNFQVNTGNLSLSLSEAELEADILIATDHDKRTSASRRFDGRRIEPRRTVEMNVTAYSPDHRSCGRFADGMTASGYSVWTNAMQLVAADTELLPFGTLVSIPGYHDETVVPVLDRGGKIKGNCIDVLMPNHDQAVNWGRQILDVTIWAYVEQ